MRSPKLGASCELTKPAQNDSVVRLETDGAQHGVAFRSQAGVDGSPAQVEEFVGAFYFNQSLAQHCSLGHCAGVSGVGSEVFHALDLLNHK